jgi:hypothetical protein
VPDILAAYQARLDAEAAAWAETHDVETEPYPGYPIYPITQDFIMQSEVGPALNLHFLQHPEDLQYVQAAPNRDVLIARLGRVEGKVLSSASASSAPAQASTPAAPAAPASKAPSLRAQAIRTPGAAPAATTTLARPAPRSSAPVPPPVGGSRPTATGVKSEEDMTADEYFEHANRKEGIKRARR